MQELTTLVSEHDLAFHIIGVNECQLKLNKAPLNFIKIPGHNFEFTFTEFFFFFLIGIHSMQG